MNGFRIALLTYLIPAVAVLVVALGYAQHGRAQSSLYLCKMPYALCTSARCVPHPSPFHKNEAICTCEFVPGGPSMAGTPCANLQPQIVNGVRVVYSTYSFKQFYAGRKSLVCEDGPWTNCLDKQCFIDPKHPGHATCLCTIQPNSQFTTAGGFCNTATCKNAYWSGATLAAYNQGNAFLKNALGLKQIPTSFCP